MSGNLFSGTDRVPNDDMMELRRIINDAFGGRAVIPPKLGDKVDHGDVDIYWDGSDITIASDLINFFKAEEYATDGKIIKDGLKRYMKTTTVPDEYGWDQEIMSFQPPSNLSMKVKWVNGLTHQIDLVRLDPGKFFFGTAYYSYNDACMLVGMLAHRLGVKFGHDGLWYVLRDGDHELGQYCLTDGPIKALTYLGFDAEKFKEGFATREEMFDWVINSKYFHPNAFNPDNRNHRQRARDAKRAIYGEFTARVNKPPTVMQKIINKLVQFKLAKNMLVKFGLHRELIETTKEGNYQRMLQSFPGVEEWIKTKKEQNEIRKAFKAAFGADAYREQFPDLSENGDLLQKVMQANSENFKEFSIYEKAELLADLRSGLVNEDAYQIREKIYRRVVG
ncbi:hypothetical protein CPT_Mendera_161 [Stenotrophomonas phage Mendera]|uniref:Uncharacterized protein n=1 Tax=Stenotrophomonas phage Mendera TaxID=2650877 RepID=A0A5P8PIY1_9CAUD|nr:DNA polymerase [Stenotrophomonas phage Mendera]QFR56687.1 hypothetical protein CPT_Mendera_161 [Stenotrophomonas phage Mendera]